MDGIDLLFHCDCRFYSGDSKAWKLDSSFNRRDRSGTHYFRGLWSGGGMLRCVWLNHRKRGQRGDCGNRDRRVRRLRRVCVVRCKQ